MKLITEEIDDVEVIVEQVNGKKNLYIEGIFLQGNVRNRNNRMYDFDTLKEGVRVYTDRYLSKGRAVGELGHPCLSEDARLLSVSNGWKHIYNCSEGELVYTLNPKTKEVEIQPINKVVINDHEGIMYTLKNRGINTKITPDHRFLIINSRNSNEYRYVTAQEIYEDLNGDNKLAKWYIPKYSLGLNKEAPEYYTISKSNTLKKVTESTEKYLEDLKIEFNTFSAFLGIYLSEGWCNAQKNGSFSIGICQKLGNKSDRISEILHSMEGLVWNESFYGDKIIWTCYDRRLGEYLSQFGNCYEKYIPRDFIEFLDSESARIFIDYFVLGDGRGELNKKYLRCDCFSTSRQLIDDISQVAVIAGLGVYKFEETADNDYIFADRVIKAENKSPLYFCRFLNSKGVYLDKRFMQMEIESWNDKVYCIQVENTNFMVEQNGYTYWTGNCGPTINLDRVSHSITVLEARGSNFWGKAKILTSLPMGKIAAGLYDEGVKLGVSSRGVGSLIPTEKGYSLVGKDFMLSTAADIVHDPSAPDAFVNGIYEGVNWLYDSKKQIWISENVKKKIEKDVISRQLTEERKLQHFENYLRLI